MKEMTSCQSVMTQHHELLQDQPWEGQGREYESGRLSPGVFPWTGSGKLCFILSYCFHRQAPPGEEWRLRLSENIFLSLFRHELHFVDSPDQVSLCQQVFMGAGFNDSPPR